MNSVEHWAKLEGFDYRFLDDAFFDILPPWVMDKTASQRVVATDLARLKWMQYFLANGYQRVVWFDADFLLFSPSTLQLLISDEAYALGREVWVQPKTPPDDELNAKLNVKLGGKLGEKQQASKKRETFKVYKKVHNAFLCFEENNHFLDFYAAHAERLLLKVAGPMPPQFIGPKLLTALHNIVQCPVQENAGMLSPWVIRDVLNGGGPALTLFKQKSSHALSGVNLCSSLVSSDVLDGYDLQDAVELLLARGKL